MKELKATKTVYCYYFPEIRRLIDKITRRFPHEVFLRSTHPGLDDFHLSIIGKYIKFHSKALPGLENFNHRYVTSGSSEGIFHLLVSLKTKNPETTIYILKGEYEGYREYSKSIKVRIVEIDPEKENLEELEKGVWFISNPSARNGNIIPNELISKICDAGHKVVVDCSYVGLTKPYQFDISHQNIIAVHSSLSKPFGLFYYRIGFTFSKEKIESLEGSIWFKNIFSLIIADKILSEFKPEYFYKKYKPIQQEIIKEINQDLKLEMKSSDVLILGYMNNKSTKNLSLENFKIIEPFRRGNFYRFCLTPYFLEKEAEKK